MNGRILKGISGYYTILAEDGSLHTLKARGRFRKDEISPVPGDMVEFQPSGDGTHSSIDEILERENWLARPSVANIDMVVAVVSAAAPEPDYMLLDKLCANCILSGIKALAVMNKTDAAPADRAEEFKREYAAFDALCCSSKTGDGLQQLKDRMRGKSCCFAGQSGVGKSSIINSILPDYNLETGELSKKTDRGKHTTRHAELLLAGDGRTLVVDTPGFSLVELPIVQPEEFDSLYPEYENYRDECKFRGCLHDSEPDCAVKQAVDKGDIPRGRWDRYRDLLADIKTKWRNRYE